ncbi:hypothetical protein CTI12_AA547270 [Artemisia annua]|uniref:Uncharacterized protein n=1 Tax=Artemisia annua TaxID=35608 RepID=A0A2U1L048_ARTAN|nr:hypothetical protein CTI12_AA547270 [Artemisia annua]
MIVIIDSQAGDGPSETDLDISPNTVSLQNLEHTYGHLALLHDSIYSLIMGDHCVGQGSAFLDINSGVNMTVMPLKRPFTQALPIKASTQAPPEKI